MKVLYVSARFPWPPDRGDRLTGFALLRSLARRHEVTLLSYVDGHEPPDALEALRAIGVRVETVHLSRGRSWLQAWLGVLSSEPSQVAFYRSADMEARARALLAERPDAVFVQLFRMAPALAAVDHPAKVLFLGDSIAMNLTRSRSRRPAWQRPGIDWERRRVAAYEVASARAFRESWVVSPVDRDDLVARGAPGVRVVPHGVDETLFDVVPARAAEPRLMFLGNLSVPHNVDAAVYAAREVLPRVRAVRPDATLWLVGASPQPVVRALAALPGVTVTGSVPNLQPLLAAAHVMLAPLRFSSGIQNKVLEAMAAGLPVVTTNTVAEGLPEATGLLRAAADADGLARETLALLADPAAATALAERARAFARERFSWDALALELERVVRESRA